MRTEQHPMTNDVAGGKVAAAAITLLATVTSYLPHVEAVLRIGASMLAIVSGSIVVWPHVRRFFRRTFRKRK